MVREALKVTDNPQEVTPSSSCYSRSHLNCVQVRDILRQKLGWVEGGREDSRKGPVSVSVTRNKKEEGVEGLSIQLVKVSHLGTLSMGLDAEEVEVRPSLVGLAARYPTR